MNREYNDEAKKMGCKFGAKEMYQIYSESAKMRFEFEMIDKINSIKTTIPSYDFSTDPNLENQDKANDKTLAITKIHALIIKARAYNHTQERMKTQIIENEKKEKNDNENFNN